MGKKFASYIFWWNTDTWINCCRLFYPKINGIVLSKKACAVWLWFSKRFHDLKGVITCTYFIELFYYNIWSLANVRFVLCRFYDNAWMIMSFASTVWSLVRAVKSLFDILTNTTNCLEKYALKQWQAICFEQLALGHVNWDRNYNREISIATTWHPNFYKSLVHFDRHINNCSWVTTRERETVYSTSVQDFFKLFKWSVWSTQIQFKTFNCVFAVY